MLNFLLLKLNIANEPKDADIIWTSLQVDAELKKALDLSDSQYTNQFPFEACLVMKHHLAETIHKVFVVHLIFLYNYTCLHSDFHLHYISPLLGKKLLELAVSKASTDKLWDFSIAVLPNLKCNYRVYF